MLLICMFKLERRTFKEADGIVLGSSCDAKWTGRSVRDRIKRFTLPTDLPNGSSSVHREDATESLFSFAAADDFLRIRRPVEVLDRTAEARIFRLENVLGVDCVPYPNFSA